MTQAQRRLFLIQSLLKEKTEYRDIAIPAEPESQRQLLRGLMNIRASRRTDGAFLKTQDAYLQGETAAKGITDIADLTPIQPGLYLWHRLWVSLSPYKDNLMGEKCPRIWGKNYQVGRK